MADEEHDWIRMHTAETIAEMLVRRDFPFLASARIWCLGRPKATVSRGRVTLAKAKLPSNELRAVVEDTGGRIDYLIVIGQDAWDTLSANQREALMYHELMHCAGWDDEADAWTLRGHDIEVFAKEIERNGAWRADLRTFFDTLRGVQQELFAPPESAPMGTP